MTCRGCIRERRSVRLDGWETYIQAIGAQLDVDRNDARDRVQSSKRRLCGSVERLESEANETETLASVARTNLQHATSQLRQVLSAPRPDGIAGYASQKQAIGSAIIAAERELEAIATSPKNEGRTRLNGAIEQTMRAMVKLEAELEAGERPVRETFPGADDCPTIPGTVERDLVERIRALSAAMAIARRLAPEDATLVEAEIASGIERLRKLVASRLPYS